nr:hypothetical protein [Tanacetum cinerariifolium]
DEKSEGDSIDYPTSEGDNDADNNGDDLSEDDADNEDEEDESIPKADIPLQKRACFTTPTSRYEIGESSVAAAARQIRPTLTIAESCRADGKLIGRLRRERRYFRTVATTYAQEVAHSRDYYARIMDYCQSREVYTSALVTQMEALQREVSTLQRQNIEHA